MAFHHTLYITRDHDGAAAFWSALDRAVIVGTDADRRIYFYHLARRKDLPNGYFDVWQARHMVGVV